MRDIAVRRHRQAIAGSHYGGRRARRPRPSGRGRDSRKIADRRRPLRIGPGDRRRSAPSQLRTRNLLPPPCRTGFSARRAGRASARTSPLRRSDAPEHTIRRNSVVSTIECIFTSPRRPDCIEMAAWRIVQPCGNSPAGFANPNSEQSGRGNSFSCRGRPRFRDGDMFGKSHRAPHCGERIGYIEPFRVAGSHYFDVT